MKPKNLIPLVVVLVALVAVTVVMKANKKPPTMKEQTKLEDLVPPDAAVKDLAKLQVYAGAKPEEKVVVERDGEDWKITSQYNAPAKKDVVEKYLGDLLKLKGEFRTEAAGDDKLDAYSLQDSKAFRIQAFKSGATDPAVDVLLGKSPKTGQAFVRKAGGNRIYIESTNLRQDAGLYGDETDKAPTADKWLDKDIVKLDKEKITKVALTMPDKELVFEKHEKPAPPKNEGESEGEGEAAPAPEKKEYEWVLASGGPGGMHKESGLTSLLQKFTTLTANTIVDPAKKADWGLETPLFKAVVSVEGGADTIIEGGRPDPAGNGYVRVASSGKDILYELSKYTFEQLFPKGSDLFDLPKLALNKDQISKIEINQPEGKVVVEKDGSDWKVTEPAAPLSVQKTALSTLATTVATWKASDYAPAGANVGEFNRSVVITSPEGTRTISLAGNSKTIEGNYAKLDGTDMILAMSGADVKKVLLKPRDVFELKLFADVDDEKAASMNLRDGDTSFSVAKEGEDKWTASVNGAAIEPDPEKCTGFLSDVTEFQAKDIRLGVDPATVQAKTEITLNLTEGEPVKLAFSAEQEGGVFLMTASGKPAVFEAEKSAVEGLIGKMNAMKEPKPAPAPAEGEKPAEGEAAPAQGEGEAAPAAAPAVNTVEVTPVPAPAPEAAPAAAPAPITIEMPPTPAPEAAPAPAPAPEATPAPAPAPEAAPAPVPAPEAAPAPAPVPAPQQ